LTDESWYLVRNTRGCTGFVSPNSNKPLPLTDEEAAQWGAEKHEGSIEISYQVGDSVRVCDGPLSDFVGIVDEIEQNQNRVRVIVSMFGRETPVELELNQVEVVED
ncbi:MAG: transcription termination/antitermination protein NusG, partial [Butyricicoccus sp.]